MPQAGSIALSFTPTGGTLQSLTLTLDNIEELSGNRRRFNFIDRSVSTNVEAIKAAFVWVPAGKSELSASQFGLESLEYPRTLAATSTTSIATSHVLRCVGGIDKLPNRSTQAERAYFFALKNALLNSAFYKSVVEPNEAPR